MPSNARDATSRSQNACDACRRRKVKCDSAERGRDRPCSKCESSEIECKFTYTRKKRRPNLAPRARGVLDTAQALVENIVSSLDEYSIPQDPTIVREMLISLAKYARDLEKILSRSGRQITNEDSPLFVSGVESASPETFKVSPGSPCSSGESDDDLTADELMEDFKQLSLGHSQERHFGRSSNFVFVHTAMNLGHQKADTNSAWQTKRRPEMWDTENWKWLSEPKPVTYIFPEDDLLWKLIDIYFVEISPYFPLLHEGTFRNGVTSGLHLRDQHFGATVLAACALASRHSNDPRNFIKETDDEQNIGWKWFRQIPLVRSNFVETTSICELQTLCLASSYLTSTTVSDAAWPLIGLGIRFAQERGTHRAKPGQPRTAESELWVRAWWCLLCLDIQQGLTWGRPQATTPNDYDIDLPAEVDDEYWASFQEGDETFVQPSGKPSVMSFCTHYIKLLQIAGSAQRTIYAVRRPDSTHAQESYIEWNQREVMKHDSALNEWADSLPEHLRWDPLRTDPVFFQQTVILFNTFYWVQTQLHKKFVRPQGKMGRGSDSSSGSGSESSHSRIKLSLEMKMSFPSLAVCANAARCSISITEAHHRRLEEGLHLLPVLLLPLANSAAILLVTLWRSKHSMSAGDSRRLFMDMEKCFAQLAKYESRHQMAGRMIDKFSALIKAENLDSDTPVQRTSTKRARTEETESDTSAEPEIDTPKSGLEPLFEPQRTAAPFTSSDIPWVPLPVSGLNATEISGPSPGFTSGSTTAHGGWPDAGLLSGFALPERGAGVVDDSVFGLPFAQPAANTGLSRSTRPLNADEIGNGFLDAGPYIQPATRSDAAESTNYGLFGGQDGSGINSGYMGTGIDQEQTMKTQDLNDWNAFMNSVDEVLYEVGFGH